MKTAFSLFAFLLWINPGISHARDITQSSVKSSQPVAIAKNINQLYSSALNENMPETTRKTILCQQLPKLFLEYMSSVKQSPDAQQQGDVLINSVKQNLIETRQYFNISCQ